MELIASFFTRNARVDWEQANQQNTTTDNQITATANQIIANAYQIIAITNKTFANAWFALQLATRKLLMPTRLQLVLTKTNANANQIIAITNQTSACYCQPDHSNWHPEYLNIQLD